MSGAPDPDYELFKQKIYRLTGVNLSLYKEEQMKRRLNTLRLKRGVPTFSAYYRKLEQSDEWLHEFLARITINVTEFFRNRPRWDVLERKLTERLARVSRFSAWSAACSTGEEAYSLAILLSRHMPVDRFSITATDIDNGALESARKGEYLEHSLEAVTPEERKRFFRKDGSVYRINAALKRPIRFVRHDLLIDPAPGVFDLVVCRNVLIYFTHEGKQTIYGKLSESLKTSGILFVGSTEQIFHPEAYRLKPAETFFYEKKEQTR